MSGACHVYLLHFNRPRGRVQHYVGKTTRSVAERLAEHRAGRGARFTRWAVRRGVGFSVARIWSGVAPGHEQVVKRAGRLRRLCPVCMELAGKESRVGNPGRFGLTA